MTQPPPPPEGPLSGDHALHREPWSPPLPLDDGPGPARRLDDAAFAALVDGTLAAWAGGAPAAAESPTAQSPGEPAAPSAGEPSGAFGGPSAGPSVGPAWIVGSLAGVALGVLVTLSVQTLSPSSPTPSAVSPSTFVDASADDVASPLAASSSAVAVEPSGTPTEATPSVDAPRSEADLEGVATEPAASAATHAPSALRDLEAQLHDQLEAANALRRAGAFAEAAAAYESLAERAPRAPSAYVATVAAGELAVDRLGDAARARRLFQRARRLRPRGPLDAEALHGLARAARAEGDASAELDALEELLRSHPESPAAMGAPSRIARLRAASAPPERRSSEPSSSPSSPASPEERP